MSPVQGHMTRTQTETQRDSDWATLVHRRMPATVPANSRTTRRRSAARATTQTADEPRRTGHGSTRNAEGRRRQQGLGERGGGGRWGWWAIFVGLASNRPHLCRSKCAHNEALRRARGRAGGSAAVAAQDGRLNPPCRGVRVAHVDGSFIPGEERSEHLALIPQDARVSV